MSDPELCRHYNNITVASKHWFHRETESFIFNYGRPFVSSLTLRVSTYFKIGDSVAQA
jgi:hypothetical protein